MTSVNLSSGLPETVLPDAPADAVGGLEAAGRDRDAVAAVVARYPRFLEGWATLGELATDPVESYAYFRVGYHRGLDALWGPRRRRPHPMSLASRAGHPWPGN